MASQNSLIIRNAEARIRIDAAIQNIEKAGIKFEKIAITNRDREVAQTHQLENFAAAFEAIAEHLKPAEKTTAAPKKTTAKSK